MDKMTTETTQDKIEVIQANAVEWLIEQASETPEAYDCIITDPPYWTLDKWRGVGTTARMGMGRNGSGSDGIDDKFFDTITPAELWQCLMAFDQLLKMNGHLYMFCDDETSDVLKNAFNSGELCFDYCKRLVWDKIDGGMGYHYRATYEFIMMFEKGKRRLNSLSLQDVLHFKRVQGKHYPTEKPLALVETLLLNSTNEGERVLDPFCGSGVVGIAAGKHNRFATLIDKSDKAIDYTMNRIGNQQPELI